MLVGNHVGTHHNVFQLQFQRVQNASGILLMCAGHLKTIWTELGLLYEVVRTGFFETIMTVQYPKLFVFKQQIGRLGRARERSK